MGDRPQPGYQEGDVKAVFNPETGVTSNYFGGEKRPDGEWHGHYDVNQQGQIQPNPRDPGVKR